MYNVVKIMAAACIAVAAVACSGDNARETEAETLLAKARTFKSDKDYTAALAALDSLDVVYRDCIDMRREGTRVRVETLLALTVDSIDADQERRGPLLSAIDSLSPLFTTVSMQGTDGFIVFTKTFTRNEMSRTCVQPRIDDNGYLYAMVNLQGRRIGLNSVSVGNAVAVGRSIAMEGSEMMTVPQEDLAAVTEYINAASEGSLTLTLHGDRGSATVRLSAAEARAWRLTSRYAALTQLLRTANIRREKYEYQLDRLSAQLDSLDAVAEATAAAARK